MDGERSMDSTGRMMHLRMRLGLLILLFQGCFLDLMGLGLGTRVLKNAVIRKSTWLRWRRHPRPSDLEDLDCRSD